MGERKRPDPVEGEMRKDEQDQERREGKELVEGWLEGKQDRCGR